MPTKSAIASALAEIPAGRSAWSRAVHAYAVELVESLDDSADLANETLLRKALLNGAGDCGLNGGKRRVASVKEGGAE